MADKPSRKTDKPSRKTFHERLDRMVSAIRDEILSGVRKEGEFLPSEKALAKTYQLSNKSVRQGLDELVAQRLIEKIPRVGNRVVGLSGGSAATLKFGCHPSLFQEAAMDTLLAEFRKQHPDIRVELVSVPSLNSFHAVRKLLDNGMLDVMTMNYNGFDDFRENNGFGLLETLDPNPSVYPFLTEVMSWEGRLKAQPFIFTPLILCYNRDHFREKNVPEPDSSWRWIDLFEQASKLAVDNERLGFYFHFPSTNRWPVFLLQSGINFERDEQGKFSVRGAELVESLRACRELIYMQNRFPLFLSEKDADAEELFFSGKVSMIMTTYLSLNHHERKTPFQFDLAPLPYLKDPKTLLMVVGLAVNRNSIMKESARKFVDFLVSYRAQLIIRQKTLSIPSLKPAAEWMGKEIMYRPSRFHVYREIIPTYRVFSALRMSMRELDQFYREAKLYWSGLETEETVAERLDRLLSRGVGEDASARAAR